MTISLGRADELGRDRLQGRQIFVAETHRNCVDDTCLFRDHGWGGGGGEWRETRLWREDDFGTDGQGNRWKTVLLSKDIIYFLLTNILVNN